MRTYLKPPYVETLAMRNGNWTMLVVAALFGSAMMFTGCKSNGGDAVSDDAATMPLAEPVEVVGQQGGSSSALDSIGAMLIRTQAEYDALGDAEIYPDVNFDENDLVIVTLGEQPTGGYAVEISGVQQVGDELAVSGTATTPAADAVVTQALTYPYDAVVIPNTDAKTVVPYID